MATHGGRCFCDPVNRIQCPCEECLDDIHKRYNGRCMCRLFWIPEVYDKWKKSKEKIKPLDSYKEQAPEEEALSKEERKAAKESIKKLLNGE